ncbi:YhgE/Pip domain-containing protein [Lentibacillus cibarius]|uniref:YhgE/Pip domain-containing protein n=1 Tax=Lentibacillus cibarius TaxID=2583219 RepID=A0A549YGI9_9BACI|nr:YhgE/Pip domain-containing protein [Lentibacillus cibarius]TRM10993.1 YhgE/Pip domain-containing protein [Lentibacillus cibarius]
MRLKKLLTVLMSAMLVVGSLPVPSFAADDTNDGQKTDDTGTKAGEYSTKDEAIYGNLDASGSLEDMYVINTFHVTEPGQLVDYGKYTDVRNLSNLKDVKQTSDNKIRFQAEKGEFYYQGDMANQPLPWDIHITYILDGKELAPDELAGKNGTLELQIATSANGNVDPVFFKNYMLQISATMGPETFTNIQAPDGMKVSSGKDTQVTFTVMPEKEETFIISADVTDFEMDPISISATPASMPIEDPNLGNMKSKMQSLSNAIRDINKGVGDLNRGISDLNDGAADLSSGSSDYLSGINELDQSSGELKRGSADIRDALQKMDKSLQGNAGAPDMREFNKVPKGLRDMAGGLRQSAEGLDTLERNYRKAYSQLDSAMSGIPNYGISKQQIQALQNSNADPKVIKQLLDTYRSAQQAKGTYQAVQRVFGAVSGTLDKVSGNLRTMATNAENMATGIEKSMKNMNQMGALKELEKGLSALATEYKAFHSGLVDYTDGVGNLATSYQDINAGIQEITGGTSDLDSGASELKSGAEELQQETSDLPGEVQSEVDEMMDEYDASDFEPQSFVSDKNEKIDVVQFVLQTKRIETAEPDLTEQTDEKEEKGFWARLMDLFR